MNDWIEREIEAAKERQVRTERKLQRRALDAQALEEQRPELWRALLDKVATAVKTFSAGITLPKPIEFTEKPNRDGEAYVSYLAPYPMIILRLAFQPQLNRILAVQTTTKRPSSADVRIETRVIFDVDDDGHVHLTVGDRPIDLGGVVELLLAPMFQLIQP